MSNSFSVILSYSVIKDHQFTEILLRTCLIISGLFSMWLISGFLCISCCIWGLAIINCLMRSGFESMLWTNGFSIIWTIISGLDISCRCIWLCSSEKFDVFKPRLLRPAKLPRPPLRGWKKYNWTFSFYYTSEYIQVLPKYRILAHTPNFEKMKIKKNEPTPPPHEYGNAVFKSTDCSLFIHKRERLLMQPYLEPQKY